MQEVGEALHRARSGRLIVRLFKRVEPGSTLLDSKGRNAAKVVELIGPVSKPYATAVPASSRVGKEGQKLYL
jgi:RNA-binding protein